MLLLDAGSCGGLRDADFCHGDKCVCWPILLECSGTVDAGTDAAADLTRADASTSLDGSDDAASNIDTGLDATPHDAQPDAL
jgi:hypothetical protein